MNLPDPASHQTGWSAKKIDGRWCVGMTGNLDTIHDAVLVVNNQTGNDDDAREIAEWVAARYRVSWPAITAVSYKLTHPKEPEAFEGAKVYQTPLTEADEEAGWAAAPLYSDETVSALLDKIDGLQSDLNSAVEVAFKASPEWVRLNYPKQYEVLNQKQASDYNAALAEYAAGLAWLS